VATGHLMTWLSKLTATVSRQPRATWKWFAVVVDGEGFRLVQRAALVRELVDADLEPLARAVRSVPPRNGAIVVLELAEGGCRVAELAIGAPAPRIVFSTFDEPAP
jgi:hypothetical protein